ncbi:hypothetical protein [Mucilaginibacter pedocola]|uniref:Uncharacterized protein n=1 Tax=Mucilaginibacter pedocola TaxID=1792845 RepID=A0A1S9PAL3_9SPHI|nr:hypothetical protein [Mucilaginibacter pedocola]OOQ58002.1 hypothetical protein BC343_10075 [Mucilaginibacter pedocola]
MNKPTIKLCYRKIIDINSAKPWDKLVFDDSYAEFRMQVQNFAEVKQYPAFGELVHYVPAARKLNQMVGPAITGYIQQLNEVVPDVLNNLGRRFLKFKHYQFEIINSHLNDRSKHQVAISFFSEPMVWHSTIDSYLLLAAAGQETEEVFTHLVQLQPYLSIHTLTECHESYTIAS